MREKGRTSVKAVGAVSAGSLRISPRTPAYNVGETNGILLKMIPLQTHIAEPESRDT
jgi:hypothetical protein